MSVQVAELPDAEMLAAKAHVGTIVSVRGSVVDVRFEGHLPAIQTVLQAD